MAANDHAEAGAGATAGLSGDLQHLVGDRDGVVRSHDALLFLTHDGIEVGRAEGHKRTRGIARDSCKRGIVAWEKHVREIGVGRGEGCDARDAQLIDQPILEGPIESLATAAGLRRVRGNMLDAQPLERATDLCQPCLVDGALGPRRMERPVSAVGIERHR